MFVYSGFNNSSGKLPSEKTYYLYGYLKNSEMENEGDIVDTSTFRPDSETVREHKLTGGVSPSANNLVYDDPKNPPSQYEIMLRNGKITPEEAFQYEQKLKSDIKVEQDSAKKKKKQAEIDSIKEKRQKYMDEAIGFTVDNSTADAQSK